MNRRNATVKNNSGVRQNSSLPESWAEEVSVKCGKKLYFVRQMAIKNAEDYLLHIQLCDQAGKQYLCAMAFNELQEFRLRTSIECMKTMKAIFGAYYRINEPLWFGKTDKSNRLCALYLYYSDAKRIDMNSDIPLEIIASLYANANEVVVTEKLMVEISQRILEYNFPAYSHEAVMKSRPYNKYMELLRKMETVRLVNTHCDYSPGNVLQCGNQLMLIDFEQGAADIPIGYDMLHYMRYQNRVDKERIPYFDLNESLWGIMHIPKDELGQDSYKPIFVFDKGQGTVMLKENQRKVQIKLEKCVGGGYLLNLEEIMMEPYSYRKLVEELILAKGIKYLVLYRPVWDLHGKRQQGDDNILEFCSENDFVPASLMKIFYNRIAEKMLLCMARRKLKKGTETNV